MGGMDLTAGQGLDDQRHGIAMSHHQHSFALVLPEHPLGQRHRILRGYHQTASDPRRLASGAAVIRLRRVGET